MVYPPPAADVIDAGDGEEVGGELEGGRDGEGGVDAVVNVGDVAHVAVEKEPGHHPVSHIKLLWTIHASCNSHWDLPLSHSAFFTCTHEIMTAKMTCLRSRGVLKRLLMFFLLPSSSAFWY